MTRYVTAALASIFVSLAVWPALLAAPPKDSSRAPTKTELYCSGIISPAGPRTAGYVISGEDAYDTLEFVQGDEVYLHIASRSTLKTGGEFLVVRAAKDPTPIPWFRGEDRLEKRMGRLWEDIGRVRVLHIGDRVVTARIESSCAPMERGDLLTAFVPRTSPQLPATMLKGVLPVSNGRGVGRVVSAQGFRQLIGAGSIVYVDLGSQEGARVGDRMILFHYAGTESSHLYQTNGTAMGVEGLGHSPAGHSRRQFPPEILGEAVVLRVSPTAATVLITSSRREIALGDYAKLESPH